MSIIIFHDNTTKDITDEQRDAIFEASSNPNIKNIRIGNSLIAFSSISRILDDNEYYSQLPEKKREYLNLDLKEEPYEVELKQLKEQKLLEKQNYVSPIEQAKKKRKPLEYMIKGLEGYINSNRNQGTGKPEKLLEKMKFKLDSLKP